MTFFNDGEANDLFNDFFNDGEANDFNDPFNDFPVPITSDFFQ